MYPTDDDNEVFPTVDGSGGIFPTDDEIGGIFPTDDDNGGVFPTDDDNGGIFPTDDGSGGIFPTDDDNGGGFPTDDDNAGYFPTTDDDNGWVFPTDGDSGWILPTDDDYDEWNGSTNDDYGWMWSTEKATTDNIGWHGITTAQSNTVSLSTTSAATAEEEVLSTTATSPTDNGNNYSSTTRHTTTATTHYELDCADIFSNSRESKSGVYKISIPGIKDPVEVYCDMTTKAGGWTVIQRRIDGLTDFQRTWDEYEQGFGSAEGEYWIGNKMLAALTGAKPYVLRIEMITDQSKQLFAEYTRVVIGGSEFSYKLLSLGKYSGNAGDSLSYHVGQKFSTFDRDNDEWFSNCADNFQGGWWFKYCLESNLNGGYSINFNGQGVIWSKGPDGYRKSLRQVVMMIRPLSFSQW